MTISPWPPGDLDGWGSPPRPPPPRRRLQAQRHDALAELVEDVGQALIRYADALRGAPPSAPTASARGGKGQPRGRRQREVLALPGITKPSGMGAAEVAEGLGISRANVYQLLNGLVQAGWLEEVPAEEPTRWRYRKIAP